MTTPQKPPNNANIQGDPLDLDELLAIANISLADIESAAEWWDEHATDGWQGTLDVEPTDDNSTT